jgi:hypothetical protein
LKRHTLTKEEAIARAKAWIGSRPGWRWLVHPEDVCELGNGTLQQPRENATEVALSKGDGGGEAGVLVVVPHGGDDEGVVIAIQDYCGSTKSFYWQNAA